MNYRRLAHGAKFWFWVALFVAYSAAAVGIVMIDTADHRYQPLSVKRITVGADAQLRQHGASQVARCIAPAAACRSPRCRPAPRSRWCGRMALPKP